MEIWVIVTGTVVLLLMLWGLTQVTRRDLQSPDEVLEEVEIYRAYGRHKDAEQVLQKGVAKFPDNQSLRLKLDEIRQRP